MAVSIHSLMIHSKLAPLVMITRKHIHKISPNVSHRLFWLLCKCFFLVSHKHGKCVCSSVPNVWICCFLLSFICSKDAICVTLGSKRFFFFFFNSLLTLLLSFKSLLLCYVIGCYVCWTQECEGTQNHQTFFPPCGKIVIISMFWNLQVVPKSCSSWPICPSMLRCGSKWGNRGSWQRQSLNMLGR